MKIGLAEIIFSIIVFSIIWYVIFKFKIIYQEKKILKKSYIEKRLDKQKLPIFIGGKEVNLKEKLGLIKKEEKPNGCGKIIETGFNEETKEEYVISCGEGYSFCDKCKEVNENRKEPSAEGNEKKD